MEVAVTHVADHDRLDPFAVEQLLQKLYAFGDPVRSHGDVFDKRQGLTTPRRLLHQGDRRLAHPPEELCVGQTRGSHRLQRSSRVHVPREVGEPLVEFSLVGGLEFHQKGRIGTRRQHGVDLWVVPAN
jgi:hypothetical protein